ncbi:cytidine deaminase [uncultured Jatrophihabitans sp.]|uniref:cytidine deaminase n=1 Tax=uncultured Jatrophihabitans sp. TaxID=1610747 RepID=UPI0035CB7674
MELIDQRFPDDKHRGAAAMLLADGTILTGTAPTAVNPSVEVCHEVEPYCGAYRLNQAIVASVCLHRRPGGQVVVLAPCGACRERLAVYGPAVQVAVADAVDPSVIVWKTLKAILPDYWMVASRTRSTPAGQPEPGCTSKPPLALNAAGERGSAVC